MRGLLVVAACLLGASEDVPDCEVACTGLADCAAYSPQACAIVADVWSCDCPGCSSTCATNVSTCENVDFVGGTETTDDSYDWASLLTASYASSVSLIPGFYQLFYTIDDNELRVGMVAKTTGWVGFGIADPAGAAMPGADMAIGWLVDRSGEGVVGDYYAPGYSTPQRDECEDWSLVAATQNGDGYTAVEITRPLDTGDSQDHSVSKDWSTLAVMGAMGSSDFLSYHGTFGRATTRLHRYDPPQLPDPDDESIETLDILNSVEIPPQLDFYHRHCVVVPDLEIESERHVIAIEPVISASTVRVVDENDVGADASVLQ